MKKLCVFFTLMLMALLISCPSDTVDSDSNGKNPAEKKYTDFKTWNGWLEHKYGKAFGWDTGSGLGALKTPITHNMLAEEYFFAKGLNAGWNLGNTYDLSSNPRAESGRYDKLMPGVKAAGFNVIRIPCSWSGNMTSTTINSSFLDSVEAAVTAAHAAGLVVFINTHHDKNYFQLNYAGASYKNEGETGTDFVTMTARFVNVWQQIATRFKDYGGWLMFEPINEPTITGPSGGIQWDGANPEYHAVLNHWNQVFIDTVRDTGGNNAKRYLLFKSYAGKLQTSLDPTNRFKIPEDPAGEGRLVYSFHSYVPQPLGLEGQNVSWSAGSVNSYTSSFYQARDAYILKGIPVFMGETGATFHSQRGAGPDSTGTSAEANYNRLLMLNALGFKAREYGVIPVLWDNGEATRSSSTNPNGETFALFRRKAAHDNNPENYGLPIDHTKLAGGSNPDSTGGAAMNSGNTARNDPNYGRKTIEAFVKTVNGEFDLWSKSNAQGGVKIPESFYP